MINDGIGEIKENSNDKKYKYWQNKVRDGHKSCHKIFEQMIIVLHILTIMQYKYSKIDYVFSIIMLFIHNIVIESKYINSRLFFTSIITILNGLLDIDKHFHQLYLHGSMNCALIDYSLKLMMDVDGIIYLFYTVMDHVFIICFYIYTLYINYTIIYPTISIDFQSILTSIITILIQILNIFIKCVVITMEFNNDDFESYFKVICDYYLLIHSIVIYLSNI